MKTISYRKMAVLGLASACATALLWTQMPLGAATHDLSMAAADPSIAGAGGAPEMDDKDMRGPVRSSAAVAPKPFNSAQAKLGSGQLLQAVQWFAHNVPLAGAQGSGAAHSVRTAAEQIAALDRFGVPAAYRDGEKIKLNIRLALPHEQIADPILLDRATASLRETLLAAGLEAHAVAGSPTLEALVPLARLEWVAALEAVAQVRLMALPDLDVTSDGLAASGVDTLRKLGDYGSFAAEFRAVDTTIAIIDKFGTIDLATLQGANRWPRNTEAVTDKLVQIASGDDPVFGAGGAKNGNKVMETVYALAPDAKYRLYEVESDADWVGAIRDAANLGVVNQERGEPGPIAFETLGEPRARTIALPLDLAGPSTNIEGLSAVIAAAKANGVRVVKSADNPVLQGEDLTIAIIDQFGSQNIGALQRGGEWPANTDAVPDKLVQIASRATGRAFGADQAKHGNAVTEIVYDVAPKARYRLYDIGQVSDWISGIQDAANLNDRNEVQGEPRAQVISFSLGMGGQSSGDGTGTGSDIKGLYDAIAAAQANGVLLIKSAGNEAQSYWDDNSTAGAGNAVVQDFVAGNRNAAGQPILDGVNILRYGSDWGDCVPVGVATTSTANQLAFNIRLTWNNWTGVGSPTATDYRLELVRWADAVRRNGVVVTPAGWVVAVQSDNAQNGGNGQTPLERVAYAPPATAKTTRCDTVLPGGTVGGSRYTGGGIFGVRIVRQTQGASNFLRLFARPHRPQYSVADRSLSSPADSSSVITVAALDAATSGLEAYSSRGPVLAAGGARPSGQAAGNAKPDMANFANVDTETYGDNTFSGTSSATPHIAALALLGLQHQRQLANATKPAPLPDTATAAQYSERETLLKQRRKDLGEVVYASLVKIAGTGGNDLGAAGFDGSYGNGRLKFHAASQSCFLSALYDASNRVLLPAQANPLPAGQKSYDQLLAESSTACDAR